MLRDMDLIGGAAVAATVTVTLTLKRGLVLAERKQLWMV